MLDGMGTLAENRDIIAAAEANKRLALQRDRIIRNIWQPGFVRARSSATRSVEPHGRSGCYVGG